MNVLILAAGYATRLGELTRNFPKPLLKVGGQTILDHLVERVREIPYLDSVYLVTNSRFFGHFQQWLHSRGTAAKGTGSAHIGLRFEILDDGTDSNESRLGAIGDIRFVLQKRDIGSADLLVCASDNILEFSLADFISSVRSREASGICVYQNDDTADLRRRGVAEIDGTDRVVRFTEKPEEPASRWAAPPIYYYRKDVLPRIDEYLSNGGNPDAPGHLIEWLCASENVCAYRIPGAVIDIGNPESLSAARKRLGE